MDTVNIDRELLEILLRAFESETDSLLLAPSAR
jgi:hypothetical protein